MHTMSSKTVQWLGAFGMAALVTACGGAPAEPATAGQDGPHDDGGHDAGEHHGGEHHGGAHDGDAHHGDEHVEHGKKEHPEMTEGMHAFHEVMAPLWHADEKSPTRFDDTCKAMPEMDKLAAAIGGEAAPPEKDEAWKSAGDNLVTSLKDLGGLCEPKKKDAFQAKFTVVHDAFHAQMELRGGKKHESK